MKFLSHRSYGPSECFFVSGSWQSEDLFGYSFSVAPPIQSLRGLPFLGSFSVLWCVRNIEWGPLAGILLCISVHQALKGAPWLGSYSVVQWNKCLMGQPLNCSTASAGVWGETMVMALPPTCDSALFPDFHGCLAFLQRHFPTQSPPSHPLGMSVQSTATFVLKLHYNPYCQEPR